MKRERKRPKKLTIDGRAFDIPLPETSPTIGELLTCGTQAEIREALLQVGMMLKFTHELPSHLAEKIGDALVAIGSGTTPSTAFRLHSKPGSSKSYGVRYAKVITYMVDDLCRQGVKPDDAWDIIGRLDPAENTLSTERSGSAGERLRKRVQRAKTK
jgi:hypothetical protein